MGTRERSGKGTDLSFGVLDYPPKIVEDRDVWSGAGVKTCQGLAGETSCELDDG